MSRCWQGSFFKGEKKDYRLIKGLLISRSEVYCRLTANVPIAYKSVHTASHTHKKPVEHIQKHQYSTLYMESLLKYILPRLWLTFYKRSRLEYLLVVSLFTLFSL